MKIEVPNVGVIEFPDGTPPDVIKQALSKYAQPQEPKGFGQTLKENLLGDDDPTTQNFGEKVGTFLNKAGESMTGGLLGDEASAAAESLMPGVDYDQRRDHYRQQEETLERENPVAALTADIGGAVVAPTGALGAVGKGASMLKRMAASGAATGAMSGLYGFMEGEGGAEERLKSMRDAGLIGTGVGAAIPFAGAGIQKAADAKALRKYLEQARKTAPTTQQLRQQGQAAYKAVDQAGVSVNPAAAKTKFDDIVSALRSGGLDEGGSALNLTPGAKRLTEVFDETLEGANSLPFEKLDQVRRKAGEVASRVDPATKRATLDSRLGTEVIEGLDDFVDNLSAADVDAGDIQALPGLIKKARETWHRMSKSQLIDDAMEAGESQYLSGSGTGIKYQFKRILNNPKLRRGFSDAEKTAMKRVVNGTIPERILRFAGSGLGSVGSIGGMGAGILSLNPGMALAGAAALGGNTLARNMSDKVIRKNAEIARALVAKGGPQTLPKASPQTAAIIEQLLRQGTAAVQQ